MTFGLVGQTRIYNAWPTKGWVSAEWMTSLNLYCAISLARETSTATLRNAVLWRARRQAS